MKHHKLLLGIFTLNTLVACTDESILPYEGVTMPEDMAQLAYLNNYDVLKNYVDRSANPSFKLGMGILVSEYLEGDLVYALACSNFDEMTAGNEMKYSSIVADDGTMDFSTVTSFIQAAEEAGMTIYGHTLCWHSQQNKTYLESLIAPTVISGEAGYGGYCLVLTNPTVSTNIWDAQVWYQLDSPLQSGQTYTLSFMGRASEDYSPQIYLQCSDGGDQEYPGGFSVSTEWSEINMTLTPSGSSVDKIAFNFGTFAGSIYIDDITLTASGSSSSLILNGDFEDGTISGWTSWSMTYESISADGEGYAESAESTTSWEELIANGDFEGTDETNYAANGQATAAYTEPGSDGTGRAYAVTNPAVQENDYNAQFIFNFSPVAEIGDVYEFSIDVRADVAATITTQAQSSPGNYLYWQMFGDINATTEWQTVTSTITITSTSGWEGLGAVAFNLGSTATTYYFDNLSFKKQVTTSSGGETIEKTDEEKEEIITNALETWIAGMMNACKENPNAAEGDDAGETLVKAWDAVNEPMDDTWSPSLKYSWTVGDSDNFYWQDYLGENYVRKVVQFAREYGGDDLILFINDYNLEASYNNNAKCEALINWINQWESDGVTKIDGIGTQMHVTYSLDPETQERNEECVERMFQLLANSGKLIKISELDMGIADENGETIYTESTTLEQKKLMSDYYTFIIEKYFELIPAAQRYGITQWCVTDSSTDSGWRAGEPIGLWTTDYARKPTYAGFANGLAGEIIDTESVGSSRTTE